MVMPAPQRHQDAVYEYLQDAAIRSRSTDPLPFTKASIAAATGLSESEVKAALDELKLPSCLVQVRIHLPNTRSGDKVMTRMARSRLVSKSPLGAAFLAMIALYFIVSNYPVTRIQAPSIEFAQTYLDGMTSGLLLAACVGVALAFMMQQAAARWAHWQAREPTKHRHLRELTKASCTVGGLLAAGYYGVTEWNGATFDWLVASGLFLAGFPIGWAYQQVIAGKADP